jgi:hypothetical protein
MKTKNVISLLAVLLIGFSAMAVLGEEEEGKVKPLYVEEVVIRPAKIDEFRTTVEEIRTIYVNYKLPYTCFVHSSLDNQYYWFCFPVKDLADLDNLFKAVNEIVNEYGKEKWSELWDRQEVTTQYRKTYILNYSPEYSFSPEKMGESNYWRNQHWYVEPGKEKEFRSILKEWVAVYDKKKIPVGYEVYVGGIGTNIPVYSVLFRGKDVPDIWQKFDKIGEIGGPEVRVLRKKMEALTKRIEIMIWDDIYPNFLLFQNKAPIKT